MTIQESQDIKRTGSKQASFISNELSGSTLLVRQAKPDQVEADGNKKNNSNQCDLIEN